MSTIEGSSGGSKIVDHAQLLRERSALRTQGRRLVHCHGCFDIVHPGHIRHLRHAKAQGDALLVTITGDAAIAKGLGRPLIPEELRAENLAALDFVDLVYIEARPTAADLLDEVAPEVYVKGKEYETNHDPRFADEKRAVERRGGRVVFSSGDVVFSSTALIHAMEAQTDPFHSRLSELLDRPELSSDELFGLIGRVRGKRVVVVGEVILDTYVLCDRPDVAGESPVMTLRPLERRHYDGGAAVIARHLAAMGARPTLVTALPDTEVAEQMRARLASEGVEVRAVGSPVAVPEKQRFMVGAQKVMKVDLVQPVAMSEAQSAELLALAVDAAGECGDAGVIADFGLGLLGGSAVERLSGSLRPLVRTLSGDVSGRRNALRHMRRMDLLAPSESELRTSAGRFDDGLPAVAWETMSHTETGAMIVSMGPEGLIAFERLPGDPAPGEVWARRLRGEHVPALVGHAADPMGCGDAMLSVATLALTGGGSMLQAGFLGAIAAAVEAQRVGNVPVSASDLRRSIARLRAAHLTYAGTEVLAASRPVPEPAPTSAA
ncbi:MAG: PfkB family carbohydrate kinase [Planctomycetota bacterium]